MTKRFRAFLLATIWLACCCACAPRTQTPPDVSIEPTHAVTAAPAVAVCRPTPAPATIAPARQFGEEATLVADGDGFSGTLRYPRCGVQPINRAIAAWASGTAYALETRAATEKADEDGMRATMEVGYDAYIYAGRFVGVKETGTYRAVVSGEAEPILYAYNYDLAASRELTLSDVIDMGRVDAVRALIAERLHWLTATALSGEEAPTAAMIQDFVLRDDGIEWLIRGENSVAGVLVDYAALGPYLALPAPMPTPVPVAANAGETARADATAQRAISLYDGVQVRSQPFNSDGEALAVMNAGDALDVVKAHAVKGWHEVVYNGQVAFVNAALTWLTGEEPAYVDGWVASGYLHVRARANAASELLGTMVFQERVRVLDANPIDGWYKILFEGDIAYVNARCVSLTIYPPEAQSTAFPADMEEAFVPPRILRQTLAPIIGVGTCITGGALVCSAPYAKAAAYGTLARGEQVYILEEEYAAGWDRIFVYTEWNSGYVGFVPARYICSAVPDEAADTAS